LTEKGAVRFMFNKKTTNTKTTKPGESRVIKMSCFFAQHRVHPALLVKPEDWEYNPSKNLS
jgi:hypothetical protein